MFRTRTMNPVLFILFQVMLIVGTGYLLSHIAVSAHTLLWMIFASVTWMGLLITYIVVTGVDRAVVLLGSISSKVGMTPHEQARVAVAEPVDNAHRAPS